MPLIAEYLERVRPSEMATVDAPAKDPNSTIRPDPVYLSAAYQQRNALSYRLIMPIGALSAADLKYGKYPDESLNTRKDRSILSRSKR